MLSAADKLRYARHLLLPEIGVEGQTRLLGAELAPTSDAEPRAAAVAAEYLERSGVKLQESASAATARARVLDRAAVAALAGRAELHEAAAALAGAFAAVEAIKLVVGVGTPAALPRDLRLAEEPTP